MRVEDDGNGCQVDHQWMNGWKRDSMMFLDKHQPIPLRAASKHPSIAWHLLDIIIIPI